MTSDRGQDPKTLQWLAAPGLVQVADCKNGWSAALRVKKLLRLTQEVGAASEIDCDVP